MIFSIKQDHQPPEVVGEAVAEEEEVVEEEVEEVVPRLVDRISRNRITVMYPSITLRSIVRGITRWKVSLVAEGAALLHIQ
jgi:hypothetical protein